MTITREFTKEQLSEWADKLIEETHSDISISRTDAHAESYRAQLALLEIALESLEAEAVAYMTYKGYLLHAADPKLAEYSEPTPLYDAPPAPVVPDEKLIGSFDAEKNEIALLDKHTTVDRFAHWHAHNKFEVIIRPCRAAMQGKAEPVSNDGDELKPAVRDALTKALAAMEFMGNTLNNLDAVCSEDVDQVTPAFESIRSLLASNSPVIPDGWVACSERMPDPDSKFRICVYTPTPHEDVRFRFVPASLFKSVCRDATHWQYMLPPAAPKQGSE